MDSCRSVVLRFRSSAVPRMQLLRWPLMGSCSSMARLKSADQKIMVAWNCPGLLASTCQELSRLMYLTLRTRYSSVAFHRTSTKSR